MKEQKGKATRFTRGEKRQMLSVSMSIEDYAAFNELAVKAERTASAHARYILKQYTTSQKGQA